MKKISITALCLLIGAAIYPFESTVVPTWKVKVIDTNGVACANMPVTEMWGHYSLFLSGDFQSAADVTNHDGFVEFPKRRIRAIGVRRVVMPFVTRALTIAHGSTGVSGAVSTSGLKDVAWLSYEGGLQLPDTATVEKCITETDLRPKEAQPSRNDN